MKNINDEQILVEGAEVAAEKTVGFYVNDSKVLIEALASADGFFVFTITKVDEEIPKKKSIRIKRKTTSTNSKKAIYQFDSFDEFCIFCTYINNDIFSNIFNLAKNTSLYSYLKRYYLVFSDINVNHHNIKKFYAAISEFAKMIDHPESFESKLIEYGKPIMKRNAIRRTIDYFG